jgi:hypothetical protein
VDLAAETGPVGGGRWREKPEIGKNPPESGEITLAEMKNHLYADVARETC